MNIGKYLYGSREAGHDTQDELVRIFIRYRDYDQCQICYRLYYPELATRYPSQFYTVMEIDHIVPFSLGGRNHVDNYQLTCKECNRAKGTNVEDI